MKKLITLILISSLTAFSAPVLVLGKADSDAAEKSIIGGNYVRSQGGTVWLVGWWVQPDFSLLPESDTHANIDIAEAPAFITGSTGSATISGVVDYHTALSTLGLSQCDEEGNDLEGGEG
ncbi:MAG: hypothetical protein WC959_10805 [Kiritimatiellales bacterium]